MTAESLVLNIAVNLGRIGRFALEGRKHRVDQFLLETEEYLKQLDNTQIQDRFKPTLEFFLQQFGSLKNDIQLDETWAEAMFTWANILTHRAKLA